MSGEILTGGMVGAGAWSDIQLAAWGRVKNAKIVALADRHPERRDPIVERFKIPSAFDSLEAMLESAPLDFVDICVRPYSHAALIKLAADRGLPVLCQKPFCTNLSEARQVAEYCRERHVPLMVNENWRWQAWYRKAKELIDNGSIGTPFTAKLMQRVRSTLPNGLVDHKQPYFAEMPRLALFELGVHFLDTTRYLFGDPHSVFAQAKRVSSYIKGDDFFVVMLNFDGLTCVVENSWASVQMPGVDIPEGTRRGPLLARLEVEATGGTLALLPDGTLRLVTDTEQREWKFVRQDVFDASHSAAQQHFIDCLNSGAEFETSGSETLKTMALVYACYQSSEEGRVISLKES